MGKLVVACHWPAVYSTDPGYVLVSFFLVISHLKVLSMKSISLSETIMSLVYSAPTHHLKTQSNMLLGFGKSQISLGFCDIRRDINK